MTDDYSPEAAEADLAARLYPERNGDGRLTGPTMKRRWSPRHEVFCQALARGATPSDSAREAGYPARSARYRARDLQRREDVSARIAELQQQNAERNQLTADRMIDQFRQDRANAIAAKQHSAAVKASEAIARVAGLWIDRSDARVLQVNASLDAARADGEGAFDGEASEAMLDGILSGLAGKLVARGWTPPSGAGHDAGLLELAAVALATARGAEPVVVDLPGR